MVYLEPISCSMSTIAFALSGLILIFIFLAAIYAMTIGITQQFRVQPKWAKRKFVDCPKGTRIKFGLHHDDVWAVLEAHGTGLVARWKGTDSHKNYQSICSAVDPETDGPLSDLMIYALVEK